MKKRKATGVKTGYYFNDIKVYIKWYLTSLPSRGSVVIGDIDGTVDLIMQDSTMVAKFNVMMEERNAFLKASKQRANRAVDEDKKKETLRKFQEAAVARNKELYGTPEWKAIQEKSWDNPARRKKASDTMKAMRANTTKEQIAENVRKRKKTLAANPEIAEQAAIKNKATQLETYRKTVKLIYDTIQTDDWFTSKGAHKEYVGSLEAPRVRKGKKAYISERMLRIYLMRSIEKYVEDGLPLLFEKELRYVTTGKTMFYRKIK